METIKHDMSGGNTIEFDLKKYQSLRRQYKHAVKKEWVSFTFEGREILVDYCFYLLAYLKSKFEPDERTDNL